jgi:hypothetical protein
VTRKRNGKTRGKYGFLICYHFGGLERELVSFCLFVIPYVLLFDCLFGLITPDLGPFGVLPATRTGDKAFIQVLLDMAG